MKLYNLNIYKKAYIELLPFVNLYDFVWKRLQFVISFCLDIFRDNERKLALSTSCSAAFRQL